MSLGYRERLSQKGTTKSSVSRTNPTLHYLGKLALLQFCFSVLQLCSEILLLLLLLSRNPFWNKKVKILPKGPCLGTVEGESQRSDVHTAPILGRRPRKWKDIQGHPRATLCDGGDTILTIQPRGPRLGCKLATPLREETIRDPRVWVLPHGSC